MFGEADRSIVSGTNASAGSLTGARSGETIMSQFFDRIAMRSFCRLALLLVVLVSVLVAPPARGETSRTGWTREDGRTSPGGSTPVQRVVESAGEVEVTFTSKDPGRFEYFTRNGDCHGYPTAEDPANDTALSPDECGRPFARASEDYVEVRGEWTFTEPGSRTVRIPIIDDDLDETDGEAFTIWAGEPDDLSTADGVYDTSGTYNLHIHIGDDDPKEDGDARDDARPGDQDAAASVVGTTVVTRVKQAPTASSVVDTASPPADLEVALPSGELEPGPSSELVMERDPEPAAESGGGASWLPLGVGAAALGSGGVMWLRRQRRWSSTRS